VSVSDSFGAKFQCGKIHHRPMKNMGRETSDGWRTNDEMTCFLLIWRTYIPTIISNFQQGQKVRRNMHGSWLMMKKKNGPLTCTPHTWIDCLIIIKNVQGAGLIVFRKSNRCPHCDETKKTIAWAHFQHCCWTIQKVAQLNTATFFSETLWRLSFSS